MQPLTSWANSTEYTFVPPWCELLVALPSTFAPPELIAARKAAPLGPAGPVGPCCPRRLVRVDLEMSASRRLRLRTSGEPTARALICDAPTLLRGSVIAA